MMFDATHRHRLTIRLWLSNHLPLVGLSPVGATDDSDDKGNRKNDAYNDQNDEPRGDRGGLLVHVIVRWIIDGSCKR